MKKFCFAIIFVLAAWSSAAHALEDEAQHRPDERRLEAARKFYDQPSATRKIANLFAVKKWKGTLICFGNWDENIPSSHVKIRHRAQWVFRFDMTFDKPSVIGGTLFDFRGDTTAEVFFEETLNYLWPGDGKPSTRIVTRRLEPKTFSRAGAAMLRLNKPENSFRFESNAAGSATLVETTESTFEGRAQATKREEISINFPRFDVRRPILGYVPPQLFSPFASIDFSTIPKPAPMPDVSDLPAAQAHKAIAEWRERNKVVPAALFNLQPGTVPLRSRGSLGIKLTADSDQPRKARMFWVFEIAPA